MTTYNVGRALARKGEFGCLCCVAINDDLPVGRALARKGEFGCICCVAINYDLP